MTPPLFGQLAACLLVMATCAQGQELAPRAPLEPGPPVALPVPAELADAAYHQLTVKFVDAARVRPLPDGGLVSLAGADLKDVQQAMLLYGATFTPLIRMPESELTSLETRAAATSGRAQPDLAGLLAVQLPQAGPSLLEGLGSALAALPVVEFATVQLVGIPPPGDIAPPTPDLSPGQAYFGPDPGMDVAYAWSKGLRGTGIRLSDCEYGWNLAHEDLVDVGVQTEAGQTVHPSVAANSWDEHGTSVLGELVAGENGYGVAGLCPGVEVAVYTEWSLEEGPRRLTAVTRAIADSAFGDVVLLEMQALGAGGGYGPAELDPALWTVVRAGTDAGVVVVAAAGNGNQDLDGPAYQSYRDLGDSGAIIVGAGTPDTGHHKMGFSTYGSRVNVQGWGGAVGTLGWAAFGGSGDSVFGDDKNQRYTDVFNGTSSAAPLVAAACCLVQERAEVELAQRYHPAVLRFLLEATGTPQGTGGHIGPLPHLRPAIDKTKTWINVWGGSPGAKGVPRLNMGGSLVPNTPFSATVADAVPNTPLLLWLATDSRPFGILGGTLHAYPFVGEFSLATDANGVFFAQASWPPGLAPGTPLWWQALCLDPTVSYGITLTNGMKCVTP